MENRTLSHGLRIGRMDLRVPGHNAATGHRIAQQTGEMLAAGAAGLGNRRLGAMQLRVQAPPRANEADIARAVSRAILNRLTRSSDA
jgi:hypothetical protein